jgi:hypothetical protein
MRLTHEAEQKISQWLRSVERVKLRDAYLYSDIERVAEDRTAAGESISYELGKFDTHHGRPVVLYLTLDDFEA